MKKNNAERLNEYLQNFDSDKVLKNLIRNDHPIIFDVGANHGNMILKYIDLFPKATIHAFEPQIECINKLTQISQQCNSKIYINPVAVGSENKENVDFYTHNINNEISGFNKVNLNSKDSIHLNSLKNKSISEIEEYEKMLNHSRKIKVIRMDDYIMANDIQNIDLLKIDTQGHEPEVLEGFGNLLEKVNIIITELMFFDYYDKKLSFSDIERYLIPAGFELFDISHISKNPMNGRTDWVDIIYKNKNLAP
jgi:FkbM family methyltransferase